MATTTVYIGDLELQLEIGEPGVGQYNLQLVHGPIGARLWENLAVLRAAVPAESAATLLPVEGGWTAILRVRGTGGVPPRQGSWRELSGPDLR